MRNLYARVQHLERQVAAGAACRCITVVRDDEEAAPTCPHGRPWLVVVRIMYKDGPVHTEER